MFVVCGLWNTQLIFKSFDSIFQKNISKNMKKYNNDRAPTVFSRFIPLELFCGQNGRGQ